MASLEARGPGSLVIVPELWTVTSCPMSGGRYDTEGRECLFCLKLIGTGKFENGSYGQLSKFVVWTAEEEGSKLKAPE